MKKIILLLLTLTLVFSLFACGGDSTECTEHKDEDKNGKCDICEATVEVPKEDPDPVGLELIKDGEALFQFVTPLSPSSKLLQAVDKIVRDLKKLGIETKRVDDTASTISECEILIGDIKTRGAEYDVYDKGLGMEGYEISIIGKKLIVTAGSDDGILEMVDKLREDILGLTDDTDEIENVTVTSEMTAKKVQTGYRITNISVDGKEIDTFFIQVDKSSNLMLNAARLLQNSLYTYKGYWLDIVDESENRDGNCVDFRVVENGSENGIDIFVENGNLVIETEFPNKAEEIVEAFITKNITTLVNKGVDFDKKFTYTTCVRYVYYSEFTVMNGSKKDDFATMMACHEYANKYGHVVRADANASYYIADTGAKYIKVMTDVEWGNATFYIDDKACTKESKGLDIFNFTSEKNGWGRLYGADSEYVQAVAGGFKSEEFTNVGFALGYPAILVFEDTTTYAYNRYGTSGNGSKEPPAMQEITRVDAEGNILPGSEFLFDFPTVTSIRIYRTDDAPITISGGVFTTNANEAPPVYDSWARGLYINRSNVTLKNIKHYIEGEGPQGAPYGGFISAKGVADILCEDLILTGHKTYQDYQEDGTVKSNMGTYDISVGSSDNIVFKNCRQTNFYKDEAADTIYKNTDYWGIMGSSYCKNVTYDGCLLSRIDAHAGMYNVTLKDSTLGWIQLTGGGKATFDNVTCYGSVFVTLRGDYGSTWDGEMIFKDCTYKRSAEIDVSTNPSDWYMIGSSWHNWSFYENHQCTLPDVTIENLKVEGNVRTVYVYKLDAAINDVTADKVTIGGVTEDNLNKYNIKVMAIIRGNKVGYKFEASDHTFVKENVTFIEQD